MPKRPPSTRSQALNALRQGAEAFNLWRQAMNPRYLKLRDVELAGVDLSGVKLAACNLRKARFNSVLFRDAIMAGSNFNAAVFTECDLSGADLRQAKLEKTTFDRCDLSRTNLFGTSRPGWLLRDVKCRECWITIDKDERPEEPETFAADEFEITHGGRRVQVRLPDGFQPIDLLALPFHAAEVLRRFPDQNLIFTGLNTVGEACLEFRLEADAPSELPTELNAVVSQIGEQVRSEVSTAFEKMMSHQLLQSANQAALQTSILRLTEEILSRERQPGSNFFVNAESLHLDTYRVGAQAVAIGPGASVQERVWNQVAGSTERQAVSKELQEVVEFLRADDNEKSTLAADQISDALTALESDDPEGFLRSLQKAGKWALDAGTKIGVALATKALSMSLGLE